MATMSEEQYLDWIWNESRLKPGLVSLYGNNPQFDVSTREGQRAAVRDWIKNNAAGKATDKVAADLGYKAPEGGDDDDPSSNLALQDKWRRMTDELAQVRNTRPDKSFTRAEYLAAAKNAGFTDNDAERITGQVFGHIAKYGRPPNGFNEFAGLIKSSGVSVTPPEPTADQRQRDIDNAYRQKQTDIDNAYRDQQTQQDQKLRWAGMLSNLSGPRDWIKYQQMQSAIPKDQWGGSVDLMRIARNTPAFGAMNADPSNSWEDTFRQWTAQQQGQPPPAGVTVAPGAGGGEQVYLNGGGTIASDNPPGPGAPVAYEQQGAPANMQTQQQPSNWNTMQQGYMTPPAGTINPNPVRDPNAQVRTYDTPGGGRPVVQNGQTFYLESNRQPATQTGWFPESQPSRPRPAAGGPIGGGVPPTATGPTPMSGGGVQGRPDVQAGDTPALGLPTQSNTTPWFGNITQPNQISRNMYGNMNPTFKANMEGQYSANAIDPQDAWATMRKAWTTGSANTRGRWR